MVITEVIGQYMANDISHRTALQLQDDARADADELLNAVGQALSVCVGAIRFLHCHHRSKLRVDVGGERLR